VIGVARLKCGEPAAEAGELIWRQLGHSFRDFFNFHVGHYSTGARAWLSDGIAAFGLRLRRLRARLGSTGRCLFYRSADFSRSANRSAARIVKLLSY